MRGTPHVHCLVCIKHDGLNPDSAESQDPAKIFALKELLKKTVTAKLISRHTSDTNDQMKYVTTSKEPEKRSSTIGHRMLTISKMQMIPDENHLIRYSITAGHYLAIMLTLLYKHVQED